MREDGKVIIRTTLDTKKFDQQLKSMGGVAKKGAGIAAKAIAGISTALGGAAVAAFKTGSDFESAMAGVRKTVDISDAGFAKLTDDIRGLAKEMPTAATEIAGVAEAAGQLGIKNDEIVSFTKTMVQLGDSTNMTAEDAATSLARLANVTQMNQGDFDKLGSSVVALGNNFATTEAEIVNMAQRMAGATNNAGFTEDQILALSTALSSVGVEAQAGGGAMSRTINKMGIAINEGGDKLNKFAKIAGMSAEDFQKKWQTDAAGAFTDFVGGLTKVQEEGGNVASTLKEVGISETITTAALTNLAGAGDLLANALDTSSQAWGENTALAKEAAQRYETTESKIRILGNQVKDLGIELFNNARNPMREVIDSASKMMEFLDVAFKKDGFSGLTKQIGNVAAEAVTGLAKAAPKLISAGGKVVKSFIKGIGKNKKQIINAGFDIAKALAHGIADMLPKDLAKSVKNITSVMVAVAKPTLKVAASVLKVASAFSGLIPVLAGAYTAYKSLIFIDTVSRMLKVLSSAHKLNTKATLANTVATKLHSIMEKTSVAIKAISAAATAMHTKVVAADTLATKAHAVATGIAAIASKGFAAAMAAVGGPLGIAVLAVGALVGGLTLMSRSSDDSTAAMKRHKEKLKETTDAAKEFRKTVQDNAKTARTAVQTSQAEARAMGRQVDAITELADKENKSKSDKMILKGLVEDLNDAAGETVVTYNEQKDALSKTNEELRDYVTNVQEAAKAEAAKEHLQQAYSDQLDAEKQIHDAKKDNQELSEKIAYWEQKKAEASSIPASDRTDEQWETYHKATGKIDEHTKSMEANTKVISEAKTAYKEAGESAAWLAKQSVESNQFKPIQEELQKLADEAGMKGVKISEDLARGITAGIYANAGTSEELKRLLDIQPAIDEALTQTESVPLKLQESMMAGTLSTDLSASDIIGLSKISNEIDAWASQNKGKKISDTIAKGMAEGKFGVISSAKDITSAVKFDSLTKKGAKVGKSTVKAVQTALANGDIPVAKAVKILQGKASFDGLKKKGKKGADDTVKTTSSTLKNGKTDVAGATDKLLKPAEKSFRTFGKNAKTDGEKIPVSAGQGVKSKSNKFKTVVDSMVKKGKPTNVAGPYRTVGTQAVAGMAQGAIQNAAFSIAIRGIVRRALAAGEDEAQVASPSKLFRDKLGKFIAQGVGVGITKGTKYSVKAMKNLVKKTAKSVKNVSGNYASIGSSFVNSFTKLIEKGQRKSEKSLSKYLKKRLKKVKKSNKSEYNAVKKANAKIQKAYKKAYSKQAKALTKQAEKTVNKLSEKYQEAYDKLKDRQDALKDTLMSIDLSNSFEITGLRDLNSGSIKRSLSKNIKDLTKYGSNLETIKKKVPDDLFAEILEMDVATANKYIKKLLKMEDDAFDKYIADYQSSQKQIADIKNSQYKTTLINDLEDNVEALKNYSANMNKLKGKVPDSLLEEILGMDTETANAYMEALNSMTTAEFENYVKMWKQKENYAASISTNLVKDDIAKLKSDYETAMNKEMKSLSKSMKKLGKNVAQGFAKGLKSQTKSISGVVKDICNAVIKQTKKSFKIKSPSKVMAGIFKQVIQGGEVGTIKEAPKLIETADKTAGSFAERFERAKIDPSATVARMERTVAAEMSFRPAAVVKTINTFEDPNVSNKVIKLEIKGGDIFLNGEKVGKQTARYVDIELGKTVTLKER